MSFTMNQRTNQRKKIFVSRAGWFSFHYPNDWQIEEDDYVAVYNAAEGLGALHISMYQAPGDVDPKAALIEHLSGEAGVQDHRQVKTFRSEDNSVATTESLHGQSFEKVWLLANGAYVVVATYIVDADDKQSEIAQIEEIVRSIKIMPPVSRN